MFTEVLDGLKNYGGIGILVIITVLAGAVSYGTSQATASITFANHEQRIVALEKDDKDNSLLVAKMSQHVDDLWHDAGYRDPK